MYLIRLTPSEVSWSTQVAKDRHREAVKSGRKDKYQYGNGRDPLADHVFGAQAELAAVKGLLELGLTDVPWRAPINVYKQQPDHAPDWEVRGRRRSSYDLLIRPDDDLTRRYVHLVGDGLNFTLFGWLRGSAAADLVSLREYGQRSKAWFVPAGLLNHLGSPTHLYGEGRVVRQETREEACRSCGRQHWLIVRCQLKSKSLECATCGTFARFLTEESVGDAEPQVDSQAAAGRVNAETRAGGV